MKVPWDCLSPQQLEEHMLWRYADPKDGEYVQPHKGDFPNDQALEHFLLSTRFIFRDGTRHIGFVHGTEGIFEFTERCFGNLCPYIVLPNCQSLNLFAFPPRSTEPYQDIQMEYRSRSLGCDVLDIYPIKFGASCKAEGVVTHGMIPGLKFYRIVREQSLFRRSKTVLMTKLPNSGASGRSIESGNPYQVPHQ